MGPWSADLPDVSPPEKQPACQRGRLFKHTLRRASCAQACGLRLGLETGMLDAEEDFLLSEWVSFLLTLIFNSKIWVDQKEKRF